MNTETENWIQLFFFTNLSRVEKNNVYWIWNIVASKPDSVIAPSLAGSEFNICTIC